jgi:uncharacterized protein
MIIYESIKKDFIKDVFNHEIDTKVIDALVTRAGIKPSYAEVTAFINSLHQMKSVLETTAIDDYCGVAVEYRIPNTSNRVDFIISGFDEDLQPNIIIIELKQWSKCEAIDNQDGVVRTFVGKGNRVVTHPSYQAWSYSVLIKEYNESIYQESMKLVPCAYLHNYKMQTSDDPLVAPQYQEYLNHAPPFVKGDAQKLQDFICKYIKKGDNKELIYHIDRGRIKPSKSLQDTVSSMIQGNEEFLMIDTQKVIFEKIKYLAKNCFRNSKKAVYIIEGGPGTGKSVLALQSLSEILAMDKNCMYVTKNAAPRNVFKSKLVQGDAFKRMYINLIMKGSASFSSSLKNEFDCLIVDEAHRLIKRSQYSANGENQIKEIINGSLFTVFFIDESQKVTFNDIGSIDEIKKWAQFYSADIHLDVLESQFRCNGSDGYIAWLDHILEIRQTANDYFFDAYDYEFKVFDNPNDMYQAIKEKNSRNNKSRLVAGYCWEWDINQRDNANHYDINIEHMDFKMSWNLGNSNTYAIDNHSIDQVGCIHTVQGLEFDYVGVIIGEDLRLESNKVITDFSKRAKTDQSLKGLKKLLKDDLIKQQALEKADSIIRNTYKTLMTRGQKGCYIYCVDQALAKYFKEVLGGEVNE